MKVVGTRELRDNLTTYLKDAQYQSLLVMKRGKPFAVIHGVKGKKISDVVNQEACRPVSKSIQKK